MPAATAHPRTGDPGKLKNKKKMPCIAQMSGADPKEWFPSWAAEGASENAVAFFDAGGGAWRFFGSAAGQMGTLHSTPTCCRVPGGLVHVARVPPRALCTICTGGTAIPSRGPAMAKKQHGPAQFLHGATLGAVQTSGGAGGHHMPPATELPGTNYGAGMLGQCMGAGAPELVGGQASKKAPGAPELLRASVHVPAKKMLETAGAGAFVGPAPGFDPGCGAARVPCLWPHQQLEKKFAKENLKREAAHVCQVLGKPPPARKFTEVAPGRAAGVFKNTKPYATQLGGVGKPTACLVVDLSGGPPIKGGGVVADQAGRSCAFRFEIHPGDLPPKWGGIFAGAAAGGMFTILLARTPFPQVNVHIAHRAGNTCAGFAAVKGAAVPGHVSEKGLFPAMFPVGTAETVRECIPSIFRTALAS